MVESARPERKVVVASREDRTLVRPKLDKWTMKRERTQLWLQVLVQASQTLLARRGLLLRGSLQHARQELPEFLESSPEAWLRRCYAIWHDGRPREGRNGWAERGDGETATRGGGGGVGKDWPERRAGKEMKRASVPNRLKHSEGHPFRSSRYPLSLVRGRTVVIRGQPP